MGIYDRDYERNQSWGQQPGLHLNGPRTLTTNLVLLTFGVYVVQLITQPSAPGNSGWFTNIFMLYADVLKSPWRIFEFLSYGFLHDPEDLKHILFNMFGLWVFGRMVEEKYGRNEYLCFYLLSIVFAGACWYVGHWVSIGQQVPVPLLGASGGISAVTILYALNYPHRVLSLFGVLPVPVWVLALLFIGQDIFGAIARHDNVAYTAHLGGAFFAFLYFRYDWRISHWLPKNFSLPASTRRSKLRIHSPEDDDSDTDRIVDEILKKIKAQGQDSLSRKERRILEKASKEYQRKRR